MSHAEPPNNHGDDHTSTVIESIGRNVPRSVSWMPLIGKWLYSRYGRRKARRTIDALLRIRPGFATINISNSELGFIHVVVAASNFSNRAVSVERLSLATFSVNGRPLGRYSEWLVAHGEVEPHSPGELQFTVELRPDEIRSVLQGIGHAPNPLSSPCAEVSASGQFAVRWGKEQAKRSFGFTFATACTVHRGAAPYAAE